MKLFFAHLRILFATHPFESLFGIPLFLFFTWYTLALTGLFYPAALLLFFLLGGIGLLFLLSKRPAFCRPSSFLLIAFLFFFACIAFITHPLEIVSEGRDQGTFVNSALLLSASHGLPFFVPEALPFFALYGEGKALNFPGLAYTNTGALIPEFPLGYTVWLAGFVTLFGIPGLTLANMILFLFSGMLFYTILKRGAPLFWSFVATLIAFGGFLPLWFLSFTLSENFALFLFLLTTESLLRFQITKDRITLLLTLTSAFALALTRIEGWAILGILIFLLTYTKSKREWLQTTLFQKPYWGIFWIILAGFLGIWTVALNTPYYKAIAKALLKNTDRGITVSTLSHEALPLYRVLFEYGLFLPLFFGLLGAFLFWKTKRKYLFTPFLLTLPTLPYLFLPHITLDAPWMLRRFLFSLYPALFISGIWAFSLLLTKYQYSVQKQRILWIFLLGTYLGLQIPAMKQFTQTAYPTTLLPQVESLSLSLSSHDLLLVDRDVTGDNFMIPARVLSLVFQRPSVYFFNTNDLATLDTSNYERVLLLTPTEKLATYEAALGTTLVSVQEFTFLNDHSFRTLTLDQQNLPQKNTIRSATSLVIIPTPYVR